MSDDLVIMADRGMIVSGSKFALLTAMEFDLFMLLWKYRPGVVKKSRLMDALYQLKHEEAEQKIIDVFVCKMRQKLKGTGVVIESHWGNGYSLSFLREPRLVAAS